MTRITCRCPITTTYSSQANIDAVCVQFFAPGVVALVRPIPARCPGDPDKVVRAYVPLPGQDKVSYFHSRP